MPMKIHVWTEINDKSKSTMHVFSLASTEINDKSESTIHVFSLASTEINDKSESRKLM
jgi:hypothetical protein